MTAGLLDQRIIENTLMGRRPELLFRCNESGRLLGVNEPYEPDNSSAPLLYICHFGKGLIYRFRHDLPKEWVDNVHSVLNFQSAMSMDPMNWIESSAQSLASVLKDDHKIDSGPVYYIRQHSIKVTNIVSIDKSNCKVLEKGFQYTKAHICELQPCIAKVVENQAVAICRTVRRSSFALEAGVDTVQGYRKRGYGSEVVTAWANSVWNGGLVPCYSTSWINKASIAVAIKMGMVQIGTEMSVW